MNNPIPSENGPPITGVPNSVNPAPFDMTQAPTGTCNDSGPTGHADMLGRDLYPQDMLWPPPYDGYPSFDMTQAPYDQGPRDMLPPVTDLTPWWAPNDLTQAPTDLSH